MKKQTIKIEITYGSDFQEEVFSDLIQQLLFAMQQNMYRKHQRNDFTFEVEDDKRYNIEKNNEEKKQRR